MKPRTLKQNGKTCENSHADAKVKTVSQRWPESLLGAVNTPDQALPFPEELRSLSRRSLRSLQLFLAISILAFLVRDFDLYTSLPESVLQILGCPPPPLLAHCALAGYIFTVLTPLTIHLLSNDKPVAQWRHLGYRSAFYGFYLCSGTLAANFVLVLTVGSFLYLLEQVCIGVAISRFSHDDGQLA